MRPIAYSRIVILSTKSNIILRSLLEDHSKNQCVTTASPSGMARRLQHSGECGGTPELSQEKRFFYYLSFYKNTSILSVVWNILIYFTESKFQWQRQLNIQVLKVKIVGQSDIYSVFQTALKCAALFKSKQTNPGRSSSLIWHDFHQL